MTFTQFVGFVTDFLCHTSQSVRAMKGGAVSGAGRWLRAASNLMFGIALGLLSYYGLTTLMGRQAQGELRASSAEVDVFVAPSPQAVPESPGPILDFAAWETEDLAYWTGLGSGEVFCRLVVPDIGVDALVVNGVAPADLRRGPGWIDWTSLPGPEGTCGISGHRTTYGAPFRRLDELAEGDTIDVFSPYRRYRYRVTDTLVVTPDRIEAVSDTDRPMLALTACHPPYSARYRLVVQAELIEVARIEHVEEE